MGRSLGTNATMRGAFEAVYGTPPAAGYYALPFVTSDVGSEQGLLPSDVIGVGRDPVQPVNDVVNAGGNLVVPCELRFVGFWCKLLMGAPTTTQEAATGYFSFAGQPAAGNKLTVNGVDFTFVAGAPGANEIQIGANLIATIGAIETALNASVDADVSVATYADDGVSKVNVTHDTAGPAGNDFTLAATGANISVSATTLLGGCHKHVFASGLTELPSAVLEVGHTNVGKFFRNLGCALNSMAFNFARSGTANLTLDVISQGDEEAAASLQADPDNAFELVRFGQFNGAISKDGVALANVTSASVTYANNFERVETIRSDGLITGVDPLVASLTGTINARFSDTVLLDAATQKVGVDLSFEYAINAGRRITVEGYEIYLPRPKMPIQGPGGVQGAFNFIGAKNTAAGKMATITLRNDQATYA